MNWKNLFWSVFRVVYMVSCILDVTALSVWMAPPKDGNVVHALEGMLMVNTLMVVIAWAFLPWPKPGAIFKKPAPAPAPAPAPIPEASLEDVCGQESLEDYLEKRRGNP